MPREEALPLFTEGPEVHLEGPGRAILLRQLIDRLRKGIRARIELVRSLRGALPRPGQVDHRIDHHVCDVDALGTELSGDGLGKNALRRLGGCEGREVGLTASRRGIPP